MSSKRILLAVATLTLVGWLVSDVRADGIAVGSSTLIGTLDYSDTFTTSAHGGNSARVDNQIPVVNLAAACVVENCYGNPTRSWTSVGGVLPTFGTFNTDATALNGYMTYPGSSNAGSNTGMTQAGGDADFGIAYDLRTKFVVQFDAVQTPGHIDIAIGSANNTTGSTSGLSVYFRPTGGANPSIGLYDIGVGEVDTGLSSGLSTYGAWHNYAVKFDLDAGLLDFYVDQVDRGQINLQTFDGGAFWSKVTTATNDYVIVGGTNGGTANPRLWTDNFQVGAPVPEPGAGVAGLRAFRPALLRLAEAAVCAKLKLM